MELYAQFEVNILDKPFTTDNGVDYDKTVEITFFNNKGEVEQKECFALLEQEEIYKKIDNQEALILDQCYVTGFSLSEYRKMREIDENQEVKIKGLSAKRAFFNIHKTFDCSLAHFDNNDMIIAESRIYAKKINFQGTILGDGKLDCTYTLFGAPDINFSNTRFGNGDVNFKNARFYDGVKDFQYAEFGTGKVSFVNTEFNNGDVSFINVNFHDGDVSFKVARFGDGKVDFHFSKFGDGNKTFERTEFGDGRVDFRTVEFGTGRVNFNRCVIGDADVDFEGCELKAGKFNFKKATFGKGYLNFELAEFMESEMIFDTTHFGEGDVSFYNSAFRFISLKGCHLDHYVDLRLNKCDYVDLSDTIVRDIIDLKPHDFDVNINIINFAGMRLIGRIYISWRLNNVKSLIKKQEKTLERQKAEQYRTLKENFNITGQYNDEDKAYVEFKRYESKANLHQSVSENKISALWEYPFYWMKWLIFDQIGLYATGPVRVLISMVCVYIFFSLLYVILPLIVETSIISSLGDKSLTAVQTAFYHSAITFLTIGYGDYYPTGIIRWFCGLEGFVGLFLMSYFTVAFVRKILR